jgi:signal-transduction protein with cAMP-binding, CBS, and nucleotidyltransferase domain
LYSREGEAGLRRGGVDLRAWVDEQLAHAPPFEGLPTEILHRVSDLANTIDEPAGKILPQESRFIIVVVGEVETRVRGQVIATHGSGDFMGDTALGEERSRTTTFVTTTPVVLQVIDRNALQDLITQVPELSAHIREDPGSGQ